MGVPKFYRWLSERYSSISSVVKENQIPDFDNLYLDMNGIIHNCSHSDGDNSFIPEEKMFANIFAYIDALLHIVRPRKLFYLAVDGVAPRAKMNQQRARRYRTAQERALAKAKAKSAPLEENEFDSNCITPGTAFMDRLDKQLQYFISQKCSEDKLWKSIKVLFSGHAAPGEGEHKIMDYIRVERSKPGYDPNTSHCLYGLDADLIILGLSSHEPHFALLREEVTFGKPRGKKASSVHETTFHLLHHSVLREYLEYEFEDLKSLLSFEYLPERIYDDWVFMGLLVGNDFIPNLPHLHINTDAFEHLFGTYKKVLPTLGGYINDSGKVNMERFSVFIKEFAEYDVETYKAMNMSFSCFDSGDLSQGDGIDYDMEEFDLWRKEYYQAKLEMESITKEADEMAKEYVKAIQWVMKYYYSGVPSWGWFYPFHYSPFATDIARIEGLENLNFEFDLGKPFMPFEQLLAVLPPLSRQHIPEAYHPLMLEQSSPILDFFPSQFELDMNGKKAEWEAVVKIKFIEEKRLLDAMREKQSKLTLYEVQRNTHGPNVLISFDRCASRTVSSPMPKYFPDLVNCHSKCEILEPLDLTQTLRRGLAKGVRLDVYSPGFPSLKHVSHVHSLRREGVTLFGQPSRGLNMIVTLKPVPYSSVSVEEIAKMFLGRSIWAGWPYFQNAFGAGLCDGRSRYVYTPGNGQGKPQFRRIQCGAAEATKFRKEASEISRKFLKRSGLDIGEVKLIIYVKLLEGFSKHFTDEGAKFQKLYGSLETPFAIQTCVPDLKFYRPRKESVTSFEDQFPVGSDCFYLGKDYYGSPAEIIGHCKTGLGVSLKVFYSPVANLIKDTSTHYQIRYNSPMFICKKTGLRMGAFNKIASSMKVMQGSSQKPKKGEIQIGFSMKFSGRNKQVIGYSRRVEGQWEFSAAAFNVFWEFASKFPDIVAGLNRCEKMEMPYEDDIVPGSGTERLAELRAWQKTLPYRELPHVECGSDGLDPKIIAVLDQSVQDHIEDLEVHTIEIEKVKVNEIFQVGENTLSPDKNVKFELGDRVASVRDRGAVPVGTRGTVISCIGSGDNLSLEVLFDQSFPGGSDLGGRCPESRGHVMQPNWLINLAHGKRKFGKSSREKGNISHSLVSRDEQRYSKNSIPQPTPKSIVNGKEDSFVKEQNVTIKKRPVSGSSRPPPQQVNSVSFVRNTTYNTKNAPVYGQNPALIDPAIQSFSGSAPVFQSAAIPQQETDILQMLNQAALNSPMSAEQNISQTKAPAVEPAKKTSTKKRVPLASNPFVPLQAMRSPSASSNKKGDKKPNPHKKDLNNLPAAPNSAVPSVKPGMSESEFLMSLMKQTSNTPTPSPLLQKSSSTTVNYSHWQPEMNVPNQHSGGQVNAGFTGNNHLINNPMQMQAAPMDASMANQSYQPNPHRTSQLQPFGYSSHASDPPSLQTQAAISPARTLQTTLLPEHDKVNEMANLWIQIHQENASDAPTNPSINEEQSSKGKAESNTQRSNRNRNRNRNRNSSKRGGHTQKKN